MKDFWNRMAEVLPEGMTVEQVARLLRRQPVTVSRCLKECGYVFRVIKRRVYRMPDWAGYADWKQANIDIARKFHLTRERVRQFRKVLGHPKVEARGRRRIGNGK